MLRKSVWIRFDHYAKLVRTLTYHQANAPTWHVSSWDAWAQGLALRTQRKEISGGLLPALRTLLWNLQPNDSSIIRLLQFLSISVRSLTILFRNFDNFYDNDNDNSDDNSDDNDNDNNNDNDNDNDNDNNNDNDNDQYHIGAITECLEANPIPLTHLTLQVPGERWSDNLAIFSSGLYPLVRVFSKPLVDLKINETFLIAALRDKSPFPRLSALHISRVGAHGSWEEPTTSSSSTRILPSLGVVDVNDIALLNGIVRHFGTTLEDVSATAECPFQKFMTLCTSIGAYACDRITTINIGDVGNFTTGTLMDALSPLLVLLIKRLDYQEH
jgi:hypothetical protein